MRAEIPCEDQRDESISTMPTESFEARPFDEHAFRSQIEKLHPFDRDDPYDPNSVPLFASKFDPTDIQYEITQETVNLMLEKAVCAAETEAGRYLQIYLDEHPGLTKDSIAALAAKNNALEYFFFKHGGRLFQPHTRSDHVTENVQDKALRAAIGFIRDGRHVDAIEAFLKCDLLQQSQMIKPSVFFEAIEEVSWLDKWEYLPGERRTIDALKTRMLSWAALNLWPKSEDFSAFISDALDKLKIGNFSEAAKLLTTLRDFYRQTRTKPYDTSQKLVAIRGCVETIRDSTENYLVQTRASLILDYFDNPDSTAREWFSMELPNPPAYLDFSRNRREEIRIAPGINGVYDPSTGELERAGSSYKQFYLHPTGKHEGFHPISDLALFLYDEASVETQEKRGSNIRDFRFLLSLPVRKQVERDFGIKLSRIDLPVQVQFLNFLKSKTVPEVERVADFCKKFGQDAFTAFLSLDYSPDMGGKILALESVQDKQTTKTILAKFAKIATSANVVRLMVVSALDRKKRMEKQADDIARGLLARSSELLDHYSTETVDPITAARELENISDKIVIFAEIFKVLRESGEQIKLEDFSQVHIEASPGREINDEDRQQMHEIFGLNWDTPERATEWPAMSADFEAAMQSPDNRYYLAKYGDEIVAFMRFDPVDDRTVYAANNNTRPSARGSSINKAFQEVVFAKEGADHAILGLAYSQDPVISQYLRDSRFVGVETIPFDGNPAIIDVLIARDPKVSDYHYWGQPKEKIISDYQNGQAPEGAKIVRINLASKGEIVAVFAAQKPQNHVLTGLARDESYTYLVFEPNHSKRSFSLPKSKEASSQKAA